MMSSSCSYFQLLPIDQLEGIYRDIQKSGNASSLLDDVRNLTEWLRAQPHLSHIEFDQSYLMSILLFVKGFEKAKKYLDFHFTGRATYPELFTDWDPSTTQFQNIYSSCHLVPAKVLTPEGNSVWIIGFSNLHKIAANDMFVQGTMLVTFYRYHSPYKATIAIFDCKQINSNIIQAFLGAIPKLLPLYMKINTERLSKIYVLHPFPMLATIMSLVKNIPILKKKVGDRIEIWNRDVNELVNVIPAECLPRDYGGSCPSIEEQKDQFYEYISQRRDWFTTECQKKARLDLRPKTTDNEDDPFGFGVNGTFRKLSVD